MHPVRLVRQPVQYAIRQHDDLDAHRTQTTLDLRPSVGGELSAAVSAGLKNDNARSSQNDATSRADMPAIVSQLIPALITRALITRLRLIAARNQFSNLESLPGSPSLHSAFNSDYGRVAPQLLARLAVGNLMPVGKITWDRAGHVTEPGRYIFTFGWLTITAADLKIWKQYPDATFTLVAQRTSEDSAGEEFRLGVFDVSPEV